MQNFRNVMLALVLGVYAVGAMAQPSGNYFHLKTVHSGLCAAVEPRGASTNGALVTQWNCDRNWATSLIYLDNLADGTAFIKTASEKCLVIYADLNVPRAAIHQWTCLPEFPHHKWKVLYNFDNTFSLKNIGSGLCMELLHSDFFEGAQFVQNPCAGAANQKFTMECAEGHCGK